MKKSLTLLAVLLGASAFAAFAQPSLIAVSDSRVSQVFSNNWGKIATTFVAPISDPTALESVTTLFRGGNGTNETETMSLTNTAPQEWQKWVTRFLQYRVEVAIAADPLVLPDPSGVEYEFMQLALSGQDDKVQSSYILKGNDGSTNVLSTSSFKYPPPRNGTFFLGSLYGKHVPMTYAPKEGVWNLPIRRTINITFDK